jgi:hypothetical protein
MGGIRSLVVFQAIARRRIGIGCHAILFGHSDTLSGLVRSYLMLFAYLMLLGHSYSTRFRVSSCFPFFAPDDSMIVDAVLIFSALDTHLFAW